MALIREFQSSWEHSTTQKDPFSGVLLSITYTDEDGDSIMISSDEELADAFEQFVTKDPPVVRAFLSTTSHSNCSHWNNHNQNKSNIHNPLNNHTTSTATTNSHNNNSNLMKLQQLKAQKRDIMMQIALEQWNETKQCMKNDRLKTSTTTDTTTNTTTNTTQSDMEATDKNTINVQETSDPLENKQDSDTSSIATTTLPEKKGYPLAFIHGRHTCDGCFTTPIIGIRYRAVNLPDYDLCQNCVQNYKGSDIVFQPEQLERDIPLQDRWRLRFAEPTSRKKDMCRSYGATTPCHYSTLHAHHRMQGTNNDFKKREDIRNMSHNVAANVLGAAIKGVRHVGHEIMEDAAFKEAVRRSLLISQPSSKEEKETEPLQDTVVVHEEKDTKNTTPNSNIVEVESVSEESIDEAEDKNVMNPSMEKVVVESPIRSLSTANILMEPLDELILNAETFPIPSNVDETADDNAGSEKDLEDHNHTNLYETSATIILHGQDTADEMSPPHSPDTVEKGEWQVLDNNGEDITQKEFAIAAQMLGSALYHSAQNESNMSSLTSVPTIESCNTNISPVVLATWRDELDMLRELGFSNDQRNVEVLERLQAANIGCEHDEKVSVERAANILLNENVSMAP